jgi:hypothetical protein
MIRSALEMAWREYLPPAGVPTPEINSEGSRIMVAAVVTKRGIWLLRTNRSSSSPDFHHSPPLFEEKSEELPWG